MTPDLTLLYYTANTISETVAETVRNHLLEVTKGKYPIVSVSQKPIDFGKNICVGVIGKSHYNCYKQIYTGALAVKTKYLACCEDDSLYNTEYFSHRPSSNDSFAYNLNWWYAEETCFWHKTTPHDTGMFQCICSTKELIRVLRARFDKYPTSPPINNRKEQKTWQEPGRNDTKFGIPNAKIEYFESQEPTLVFNYYGSMGGLRGSRRPQISTKFLPNWGSASDLWQKYWQIKQEGFVLNACEEGKKEELNFWKYWLANLSAPYLGIKPLISELDPLVGKKKKVTVANLGSGPLCLIGQTKDKVEVKVDSSDLMAAEYNKMLKDLKIHLPYRIKKQDMTNLTYKDNTFDIVFCANSIDHCIDPEKAIKEMVRVCKPGGWVYLKHIAHSGERERYRGMHQWNVDMLEDGDSIIWNNAMKPFLLSDIKSGFKTTIMPARTTYFVVSYLRKGRQKEKPNIDTEQWETGEKDEIAFWRYWLSGKTSFCERINPLIHRLDFMIGDKKVVKIANLGAGPRSIIGDAREGIKVEVVSSDLLADEYKKLFEEFNIKPAFSVERQDMTRLTYPDATFDIVVCTNALDHCLDPYRALKEMVRICKLGGWIFIEHFAHEGKRHGYKGFHKWNLDVTEDNDCIIWNKKDFLTDTFLLSDIYPGFSTNIRPSGRVMIIRSFVQKK